MQKETEVVKKNGKALHREPLALELSRSLLNIPTTGGASLWQRLEAARDALGMAVAEANREMQGNPVAEILSEHARRQIGRRGVSRIVVDPDGTVILEVHHEGSVPKSDPSTPPVLKKSSLPTIGVLREEAKVLGIDPTPFGKNKTRLLAAIQEERGKSYSQKKAEALANLDEKGPVQAPVEPPKRVRTAPALTPVTVVQPDNLTILKDADPPPPSPPPSDDDGGEDLSALFKPATTTPPRRGVPAAASAPTKTFGGRTLSDLARSAPQEVDINAILAKPAPAPLSEP